MNIIQIRIIRVFEYVFFKITAVWYQALQNIENP